MAGCLVKRLGGIVMPVLLMAALVALLYSGALPALILFLPALLMLVIEQEPGRPMTRILLLFGLAGSWDVLDVFWHAGSLRISDGMGMLDLDTLARAWLAQAVGWLLAEGLSLLLTHVSDREQSQARARTEADVAALRAEWRLRPAKLQGG